jgi:hypothetical protein
MKTFSLRLKTITDSGRKRSPIPAENDHLGDAAGEVHR